MAKEYESTSINLVLITLNLLELLKQNKDVRQDDPVVTEFRAAASKLTTQLILASRTLRGRP